MLQTESELLVSSHGDQLTIRAHGSPTHMQLERMVRFVREQARWDSEVSELRLSLSSPGIVFEVHDAAHMLVATATLTCIHTNAFWVGFFCVRRDMRRRGIGEGVMRALITHCKRRGAAPSLTLSLLATIAGAPLYRRLSYAPVAGISPMQLLRPPLPSSPPPPSDTPSAVSASPQLHGDAVALYNEVMRNDRSAVLHMLFGAHALCAVARCAVDGSVVAAAWGRPYVSAQEGGARGVFVGPVVGHDDGAVAAVVSRLLCDAHDRLRMADGGGEVMLEASAVVIDFAGLAHMHVFEALGFRPSEVHIYMALTDDAAAVPLLDLVQCDRRRYYSTVSFDVV